MSRVSCPVSVACLTLCDLVRGRTFDDFSSLAQYSVIERRDPAAIDLTSRFSEHLTLKRPIVSANMDTVTRSEMAIAVAEEGGIGIIDRGFRSGEIEPQVREVADRQAQAARHHRRPVHHPRRARRLAEAAAQMRRTGVGTLVVVDGGRRVQGLLTTRDLRFVDRPTGTVASRMTPRERLIVHDGHARSRRRRPSGDARRTRSRSCRSSTPTARCSA